ncbi:MAG: hypothetical protein EHM28_10400, partial [Spirochaetaceae bacterium]
MEILITIVIILSAALAVAIFLFLTVNLRIRRLRKVLVAECSDIAENLGKISFGYLDSRLDPHPLPVP